MELKLYKIISGPPNVLTQYGFDMIPDRDFLLKTLILGTIFFGTPASVLRLFPSFMEVSRVFQGSLKVVSRKLQGCFEGVLRVLKKSFNGVLR